MRVPLKAAQCDERLLKSSKRIIVVRGESRALAM